MVEVNLCEYEQWQLKCVGSTRRCKHFPPVMLDFRMGDCAATIKFILLQSSPHTFLIAERFNENVFE